MALSKIVKKQLEDCKKVNLPEWNNETTTHIYIPKGSLKKNLIMVKDHCYFIEIADYILFPSKDFTLASNWNNGTVPPCKYMNICVSQVMGKMVKVDGISVIDGIPTNDMWSGWLPIEGLIVKKEV